MVGQQESTLCAEDVAVREPDTRPASPGSWARHIPNAITLSRGVGALLLFAAIAGGRERLLAWLLLACLASDFLDGFVARLLRCTSHLGAVLDTMCDIVMHAAAIAGAVIYRPDFLRSNLALIGALALAWPLLLAMELVRYRRPAAFHTYNTKIAAALGGVFVALLLLDAAADWLFYIAAAACAIACVERGLLVLMLPVPRSDLRGLYWVLKERTKHAAILHESRQS
jgi:cardiolipin synthase